jgi:hypothetical protein
LLPIQIHGTCLGHQLLHILAANVSRNDLLVETDAVTQPSTLIFTAAANTSRTLKDLPVGRGAKFCSAVVVPCSPRACPILRKRGRRWCECLRGGQVWEAILAAAQCRMLMRVG